MEYMAKAYPWTWLQRQVGKKLFVKFPVPDMATVVEVTDKKAVFRFRAGVETLKRDDYGSWTVSPNPPEPSREGTWNWSFIVA